MGFALFLGRNVRSMLIGRSLGRGDLQRISGLMEADDDLLAWRTIRSMHLEPRSALLGVGVKLRRGLNAAEQAAGLNRLERAIKAAVPERRYVHLEDHL